MVNMKEKEISKKNLLMIQRYEFELEVSSSKILEEKWREFSKHIVKPTKPLLQTPDKENMPNRIHYHRQIPKKEHIAKKEIPIKETPSRPNIAEQTNSTSYSNQENIQQAKRKVRIKRELEKVININFREVLQVSKTMIRGRMNIQMYPPLY
jgi:hypothetical protein